MKARYTTEEFKVFLKAVHGDKYDYSKLIYVDSSVKIEVVCKEHDSFWISPKDHKQGAGCIKCSSAVRGFNKRTTPEDFLKKFQSVFGESLTCDHTQYTTNSTKVIVNCTEHGDFTALPSNLLAGKGCKHCGFKKRGNSLRSNTETFIEKALIVFGNKYDYSNVDYTTNYEKIEIVCKDHGSFWMQPNNHLMGKGCSACQSYGYNKGKPGTFYILVSDNLIKVGITNREVNLRVRSISKSSGKDFKVHTTFFSEDGSKVSNIEAQVLSWLKSKYSAVTEVFDGSTECFTDVNLEDLLNFVTQFQTIELQSSLQQLPKE